MPNAVPPDAYPLRTLRSAAVALRRYALAAAAVMIALAATLIVRSTTDNPTFLAFYAAIFVSFWFIGRGPGLMSLALSALTFDTFLRDVSDPMLSTREAPTLFAFIVCALAAALLTGQRHRAERSLKAAGEHLELAVRERTEQLRRTNQDLQREAGERERVEAALRASDARWRAVFESSSVGIATRDTHGRILTANPAFQEIVGYSQAELQALELRNLYHADESADTEALSGDLVAGRKPPYQVERRLVRKDGHVIWVSTNESYISTTEGGQPFLASIIVDITERKRTDLERRRLALLVEQAADLMAIADVSGGTPIYLNKAGLKMVGFDSWEEGKARRGSHYVFPEDRPFINEVVWPTVMEWGSWSGELRFRHFKTGEAIPVLYSAFLIDDPETGQAVNVGNVCRDITERKRAEEALRSSEERWRSIFENSGAGITTVDGNSRYTSANRAFQQMVGYTLAEILRLSPLDLVHQDERPRLAELIEGLLSGRYPSLQIETRYRRKDGEIIWISASCSHVPKTGTAPAFYQAIIVDITERVRAEAQARENERRRREVQMELEHANRVATVGHLTASIAHEVNQPIAATVTNAQAALSWLDGRPPDLAEVREALAHIANNGIRAGEVIGRIRDLIKKVPPRKDRFDVNATIREVIALTRGETLKNRVSVQTQLAGGLPPIDGDRVQLQQVILNLIINALEAMVEINEGRRELLISSAETDSNGVLVAVRDSGPGLAPIALQHLFESFYTTKQGGMGLGLSICRSIIEAHGGRLWASANTPRGAAFQFTLPADRDHAA
jgi:PAS domain S-box-containing protein